MKRPTTVFLHVAGNSRPPSLLRPFDWWIIAVLLAQFAILAAILFNLG